MILEHVKVINVNTSFQITEFVDFICYLSVLIFNDKIQYSLFQIN